MKLVALDSDNGLFSTCIPASVTGCKARPNLKQGWFN